MTLKFYATVSNNGLDSVCRYYLVNSLSKVMGAIRTRKEHRCLHEFQLPPGLRPGDHHIN